MILLILTAATILISTVLRNTIFFHDIALERKEHICQIKALEALAWYGIAMIQSAKDHSSFGQTQEISPWPPKNGIYQATVAVTLSDGYHIKAQIMKKGILLHTLLCKVAIENSSLNIMEWAVT